MPVKRLLTSLAIVGLLLSPSPAFADPVSTPCDDVSRPIGTGLILNYGYAVTPAGWGSYNQKALIVVARGWDNQIWAAVLRIDAADSGRRAPRFNDVWDQDGDGRVIWYPMGGLTDAAPEVYGGSYNGSTYTTIYVQGVDGGLWVNSQSYGQPWSGWQPAGSVQTPFADKTTPAYGEGHGYVVTREPFFPIMLRERCWL